MKIENVFLFMDNNIIATRDTPNVPTMRVKLKIYFRVVE